jgi:hypothetical protein
MHGLASPAADSNCDVDAALGDPILFSECYRSTKERAARSNDVLRLGAVMVPIGAGVARRLVDRSPVGSVILNQRRGERLVRSWRMRQVETA